MAKFNVKTDAKGELRFTLVADNGQAVLSSEGYKAKASLLNGIESVRKHAVDEKYFEVKEAANGKHHFNLKASNGQVIGTSQMYATEASRDAGIASAKVNGVSTTVKDSA